MANFKATKAGAEVIIAPEQQGGAELDWRSVEVSTVTKPKDLLMSASDTSSVTVGLNEVTVGDDILLDDGTLVEVLSESEPAMTVTPSLILDEQYIRTTEDNSDVVNTLFFDDGSYATIYYETGVQRCVFKRWDANHVETYYGNVSGTAMNTSSGANYAYAVATGGTSFAVVFPGQGANNINFAYVNEDNTQNQVGKNSSFYYYPKLSYDPVNELVHMFYQHSSSATLNYVSTYPKGSISPIINDVTLNTAGAWSNWTNNQQIEFVRLGGEQFVTRYGYSLIHMASASGLFKTASGSFNVRDVKSEGVNVVSSTTYGGHFEYDEDEGMLYGFWCSAGTAYRFGRATFDPTGTGVIDLDLPYVEVTNTGYASQATVQFARLPSGKFVITYANPAQNQMYYKVIDKDGVEVIGQTAIGGTTNSITSYDGGHELSVRPDGSVILTWIKNGASGGQVWYDLGVVEKYIKNFAVIGSTPTAAYVPTPSSLRLSTGLEGQNGMYSNTIAATAINESSTLLFTKSAASYVPDAGSSIDLAVDSDGVKVPTTVLTSNTVTGSETMTYAAAYAGYWSNNTASWAKCVQLANGNYFAIAGYTSYLNFHLFDKNFNKLSETFAVTGFSSNGTEYNHYLMVEGNTVYYVGPLLADTLSPCLWTIPFDDDPTTYPSTIGLTEIKTSFSGSYTFYWRDAWVKDGVFVIIGSSSSSYYTRVFAIPLNGGTVAYQSLSEFYAYSHSVSEDKSRVDFLFAKSGSSYNLYKSSFYIGYTNPPTVSASNGVLIESVSHSSNFSQISQARFDGGNHRIKKPQHSYFIYFSSQWYLRQYDSPTYTASNYTDKPLITGNVGTFYAVPMSGDVCALYCSNKVQLYNMNTWAPITDEVDISFSSTEITDINQRSSWLTEAGLTIFAERNYYDDQEIPVFVDTFDSFTSLNVFDQTTITFGEKVSPPTNAYLKGDEVNLSPSSTAMSAGQLTTTYPETAGRFRELQWKWTAGHEGEELVSVNADLTEEVPA